MAVAAFGAGLRAGRPPGAFNPLDIVGEELDLGAILSACTEAMQYAKTRLTVVILDACRNNPFSGRGLRSSGGGLAEMRPPEGTMVAYSTQPGKIAADGTGANSPFSQTLATTLVEPGLDLFGLFNQVA